MNCVSMLSLELILSYYCCLFTFALLAWCGHIQKLNELIFVNLQIESNFIISSKLSVEGPLRMKEEYVEGIFESPKINEEAVPEQLKGAFGQAVNTVQQLPAPIRDAVSSGLKIPLGESFEFTSFQNVFWIYIFLPPSSPKKKMNKREKNKDALLLVKLRTDLHKRR